MELKDKIAGVIGGVNVAAVATVKTSSEVAPRVRYMGTVGFPDLTLQSATAKSSPKVQQIRENPKACLTIWKGTKLEEAFTQPYVIMDADVEVLDDEKTKNDFWNPMLENSFSGPDDPEYVVLKFTPTYAEYWLGGQVEQWTP
ncbi:MAG: pyridoxamine 5'-phosphate oxidase family protein [Halobacteriota archaeon]